MTAATEVTTRDSSKEDAEQAARLESVRQDLKISDTIDPLDALLAIDKKPSDVNDTVDIPIVGGQKIPWSYRALGGEEIDDIDEMCTIWVKRGRGDKVRQRDTQRFERMVVAKATIRPNLNDQRLVDKYGTADPEKIVAKVLMPGTYDGLATKVLELSGYTDELIGTAGN